MGALSDAPLVEPADRAAWRDWLEANHATLPGAWLVMWKPGRAPAELTARGVPLDYEAAVEEALCFGWIDSTGGQVDADRGKLYFARRKPRSVWAATNKARVERLTAAGRMAPAGLEAVERAKANGWWTILDSSERLEVPDDLAAALDARAPAAANFAAFPPSARKMLLGWLAVAVRPETRAARVQKIAVAAQRNERAQG
jgi:uncharacterized protein YdeI (YjbR/CyaY-like superfamily)